MAGPVGSLLVRIGGDVTDLKKSMAEGERAVDGFGTKARSTINVVGRFAAAATAAGAALAAEFTRRGLAAVDAQAKLARSLDATIDGLRGVQLWAKDGGIDNMEKSLTRLNRRLGGVEQGGGPAARAIEGLNLNARELAEMDIDQRMAAIADAVRDFGGSNQEAARHLQHLGFEQANAVQLFRQGGDAIREAKDEIIAFGLSLNEVDAAKVEIANDAMSRFGLITEGVQQQLAVKFAPILSGIANEINRAMRETGGFAQQIETTIDHSVRLAGVFADGLHGARILAKGAALAFQGLGTAILSVISQIYEGWTRVAEVIMQSIGDIIRTVNRVPGIDIPVTGIDKISEGLRNVADEQVALRKRVQDSTAQTAQELHELLMRPLPSDSLRNWVEEARKAAQEAAEEMAAAGGGGGGDGEGVVDEGRRKELERLRQQMESRLEVLRDSFATEREMSMKKYEEDLALLEEAFASDLLKREEYQDLREQSEQAHQDRLTAIEERSERERARLQAQSARAREQMWASFHGNLATIAQAGGERLFDVSQTIGAAQAFIATLQGQAEALKLGWPQGLIAAAAIGAAGFRMVAGIKSATSSGGGSQVGVGAGAGISSAPASPSPSGGGGGAQGTTIVNLTGDFFSAQQVRNLVDEINEQQRSGSRL